MSRSQEEFRLHCWVADCIRKFADPSIVAFHPASGEYRPIATARRLQRMLTIPGVPDLVFILPQRVAFLELKSAKGRLTPEQAAFRDRVTALGHWYEIARTGDEAIGILRAWGVLPKVRIAA